MFQDKQPHQQVARLMEVEIDRRDFLRYLSLVALGLVGVTGLLKTIKSATLAHPGLAHTARSTSGFGRGPYGR